MQIKEFDLACVHHIKRKCLWNNGYVRNKFRKRTNKNVNVAFNSMRSAVPKLFLVMLCVIVVNNFWSIFSIFVIINTFGYLWMFFVEYISYIMCIYKVILIVIFFFAFFGISICPYIPNVHIYLFIIYIAVPLGLLNRVHNLTVIRIFYTFYFHNFFPFVIIFIFIYFILVLLGCAKLLPVYVNITIIIAKGRTATNILLKYV